MAITQATGLRDTVCRVSACMLLIASLGAVATAAPAPDDNAPVPTPNARRESLFATLLNSPGGTSAANIPNSPSPTSTNPTERYLFAAELRREGSDATGVGRPGSRLEPVVSVAAIVGSPAVPMATVIPTGFHPVLNLEEEPGHETDAALAERLRAGQLVDDIFPALAVIPEPGSLGVGVVLALGLTGWCLRRQRTARRVSSRGD